MAKKVYNWKCLLHDDHKGDRLAVWDRSQPVTIGNLALMCKDGCEKHMKAMSVAELGYSNQIVNTFV